MSRATMHKTLPANWDFDRLRKTTKSKSGVTSSGNKPMRSHSSDRKGFSAKKDLQVTGTDLGDHQSPKTVGKVDSEGRNTREIRRRRSASLSILGHKDDQNDSSNTDDTQQLRSLQEDYSSMVVANYGQRGKSKEAELAMLKEQIDKLKENINRKSYHERKTVGNRDCQGHKSRKESNGPVIKRKEESDNRSYNTSRRVRSASFSVGDQKFRDDHKGSVVKGGGLDASKKLKYDVKEESKQKRKAVQNQTEKANITELFTRVQSLERQLREKDDSIYARDRQIEELTTRMHSLKAQMTALEDDIVSKNKTIEGLTQRLSLEMGMKISANESSLENICNKLRPTTIAEAYELLCSNEWLGAKQALDKFHGNMPEYDKLKLLCKTFQTGYEESERAYNTTVNKLSFLIQNPCAYGDFGQNIPAKHLTGNGKILHTVQNALRETSKESNIESIVKAITSDVLQNDIYGTSSGAIYDTQFRNFIEKVARLTWHMAIQQPPMTFDQSGINMAWKGEGKQIAFWTSSSPSRSKVKFYVHPALYHGDLLMVKGRVMLG